MAIAYVIQTNSGYRLFDSFQEAADHGDGYDAPLEVKKESHYHGPCGRDGVLFGSEDISSRQFSELLAQRQIAEI